MAKFNDAQLKRMQLLAGATPEFMNFSHYVLESCLVRALLPFPVSAATQLTCLPPPLPPHPLPIAVSDMH